MRAPSFSRLAILIVVIASLAPPHVDAAADIAVIRSRDLEPYNQAFAGFSEACSSNVNQYTIGGDRASQQRMTQAIADSKPRLVLAIGLVAAKLAKENLKDVRTLYIMVSNPKKYDLVGNNIAGITLNIPVDAQFKAYKTLVPGLKSIGVIYDASNSGELVREASAVAKKLGVELAAVSVRSHKEVPEALRGMLGKVDAIWMVPDETVVTTDSFRYFLVTTLENGVPFFAASEIFVEAGALAALTPDYTDVGRQGCQLAMGFIEGQAMLADAGARPPRKVNLSLNLKTAKKIGLAIPASVIDSAKVVYR
ncbi:MAG TPA: ABC transporter substrate-binding protein [Casimicrobiaceae bacterium]|nr:ABC transporter substrate-binding protein [Casimicrobiaceae bacterium]